jgi:hypothetical protein
MTLPVTAALAALLLGVALIGGWRGARPPNVLRGPRMMPWRLIMVTATVLLLMVVVHLVNLLGVTTGR